MNKNVWLLSYEPVVTKILTRSSMAPSGKLRFIEANKQTSKIGNNNVSNEKIHFKKLTDINTDISPTDTSRENENQSQVTRTTMETTETVSTLSNGTSLITFDSFATKWNLREAVKGVLFHKKPYINDQSELEFSEDNDSVCMIILNELNVTDNNETRKECWKQIQGYVPGFLNKKRTAIVQTIKKKFKGKSYVKSNCNTNE